MPRFVTECYTVSGERRDVVVEADSATAAHAMLVTEYNAVGIPEPLLAAPDLNDMIGEELLAIRSERIAREKAAANNKPSNWLWYIAGLLIGIPGTCFALFMLLGLLNILRIWITGSE